MAPKKILILSVSSGAGHTRAAESIRVTGITSAPDVVINHLDCMQFVTAGMRKIYTDFYIALINRTPSLWAHVYNLSNSADPTSALQRMRRGLERINARRLLKEIEASQADAIICTHFLPAEILSQLTAKGDIHCPVWVQVTDFDLHRTWVHPHITGYFAANEEVAFRMRDHGIPPNNIYVTGIPIMPAFALRQRRTQCAEELGLDPNKKTFLLMGGGAGVGSLDQIAERLLALEGDFQLIVLAGKNRAAFERMQSIAKHHPQRLFPQSFTPHVERLMACADLVITKPGGLTTSECLAMGLPMIVNAPIPGQEERNADYLLEQGAAMTAFDATSLAYRVQYLLSHPEKLADMSEKARALGRPHAAQDVLKIILQTPTNTFNSEPMKLDSKKFA